MGGREWKALEFRVCGSNKDVLELPRTLFAPFRDNVDVTAYNDVLRHENTSSIVVSNLIAGLIVVVEALWAHLHDAAVDDFGQVLHCLRYEILAVVGACAPTRQPGALADGLRSAQ